MLYRARLNQSHLNDLNKFILNTSSKIINNKYKRETNIFYPKQPTKILIVKKLEKMHYPTYSC